MEALTNENQTLKTSLEIMKKSLEENEIILEVFTKKANEYEQKCQQKRDLLLKTQLQYKIAVAKVESLREDLQSVYLEKAQLQKHLSSVEENFKQASTNQLDISDKIKGIKKVVNNVKYEVEMVKKNQAESSKLAREIDLSTRAIQKCDQLKDKCKKLADANLALDELCVKLDAKNNKLCELIDESNIGSHPYLETEVLLKQCTEMHRRHKDTMEKKDECLRLLNEKLYVERENNVELIKSNKRLQKNYKCSLKQIEHLKQQLETSTHQNFNKFGKLAIKSEPVIEIMDSPSN
ncbi:uncharacterized protein LOC132703439 [Cylas formicarius]|nr:uncharacterized protein LOC132703439 [Cylas formicarius]